MHPRHIEPIQVDEMFTYVGNKAKRICIAYSYHPSTKSVLNFVVGSRNKKNLKRVIEPLLAKGCPKIITDKLNIYKEIIPSKIHSTIFRGTNKIERMNLTLRTHLKRLSRRSLCFTKSTIVITAVF